MQSKTIQYPSGVEVTRYFDDYQENWKIDNKALSIAHFTLSIDSSRNVHFTDDQNSAEKTVVVGSKAVDSSIRITKTPPYKFKMGFTLSEEPLPIEEQKQALAGEEGDFNKKIEESERLFKTIPYEVLTHKEIAKKMKTNGVSNFIDPHFPPRNISLYNVVAEKYPFKKVVKWKRPQEFMQNPVLFENDVDPNDIKQGELGDCWFLSACACIAERPGLVKRLFITQEYNPEGIYKLRLCKNGEWVTVTIDDYIPCSLSGGPLFGHCARNELWVSLLEKAYAKLHGSYHALDGGLTSEAMFDLTGCPTKSVQFPKKKDNYKTIKVFADDLFDKMLKADDKGHMICSGTAGVDNLTDKTDRAKGAGLVSGHAYSVIQVKEGLGVKLLNIRNPWGEFEWNGAWADNSKEWTKEAIKYFKPDFNAEDGTFWMRYEDFLQKFEEVSICKVDNYNECRFKGKFIKSQLVKTKEESVVSKFYYTFKVLDETEITFGIHQEDERVIGAHLRKYIDVGFVILKLGSKLEDASLVDYCDFKKTRDVSKTIILKPGLYAFVPLTTGASMQKTNKASSEAIPPKFKFDDMVWPHPYFSSTINDVFRKIDLAANGVLSAQELNQFGRIVNEKFFKNIKTADFTSSAFEDVSCNKDGVSLLGFKQLLFRNFNNREIIEMLSKLGYDEALNSLKTRVFMVSFLSTEELVVRINDAVGTNYYNTAWEKLLKHKLETEKTAEVYEETDEYLLLACFYQSLNTHIYGLLNNTGSNLKFKADFSESQGCIIMPGGAISTRVAPPYATCYLGTTMAAPDSRQFSGQCAITPL